MQVNLRKALLDAAEHLFVPFDLEIGMQAALHQDPRAAQFYGLLDLVVDGVEIQDVALFGARSFQRTVEGAEGAVLGAKVGVINVAVNDVGDRALGMDAAANRVGLHADADEVIGLKHLQSLLFGQGHSFTRGFNHSSGGGTQFQRMTGQSLIVSMADNLIDGFMGRKFVDVGAGHGTTTFSGPIILEQPHDTSQYRQGNQHNQRRSVVLRKETHNVPAVMRSEESENRVSDSSAQSQGSQEFISRIAHGPR